MHRLSVPLPPFAKRMVGRGQGWGALVLSAPVEQIKKSPHPAPPAFAGVATLPTARCARGGRDEASGSSGVSSGSSVACARHCEERSDEAIQGLVRCLDCFAALAMTRGHDRYAVFSRPSRGVGADRRLILLPPRAPMGRPHVEPLLGLRVDPAGENAPAREYERVRTVTVEDGEFEVAVERRAGDRLPHARNV
jgi:hypothetical protein